MEFTKEEKQKLQFNLDKTMLELAQKCIKLSDELKKTLNYWNLTSNLTLMTF